MPVGLAEHRHSSIEALGMRACLVWGVSWCARNDVAADVACLEGATKLAVDSSI